MPLLADRAMRKGAILAFRTVSAPFFLATRKRQERLGSSYGGWWVPCIDGSDKVAYCLGAGEDVTFDLALEERGWLVRTVDPTPRAISHVESVLPSSGRMVFLPFAAWSKDEILRFYEPADQAHVSHSAINLQRTSRFIEVPALSLPSMLERAGDLRMDLLKLDIEGAEHEVLGSLADLSEVPPILCVEFDAVRPVTRLLRTWVRLARVGYRPWRSEGLNVLFVNDAFRRTAG